MSTAVNSLSEQGGASPEGRALPFITVIMPVFNEEAYIGRILAAVLAQDYPAFEVVVADGGSSDRTQEIVRSIQTQRRNVRLIENPERIVSTGLNRAIHCARGEIIVRLDGHCEYPKDYLRQIVELRERLGADNVGGVLVPAGTTWVQKSIAAAYYSPVGVGGAALKAAPATAVVREVDAVHGGCWRRERLLQVGGFDETMVRNQDDELSFRLRKNAGKIFQTTALPVKYHVRNSFKKLFLQFAQYGYWKVRVVQKHPQQASLRHFAPALFVLTNLALAASLPFWKLAPLALCSSLGVYLSALGLASLAQLWRGETKLWPGVIMALLAMHAGYGSGFVLGCLRTFFGPLPTDKIFERVTR